MLCILLHGRKGRCCVAETRGKEATGWHDSTTEHMPPPPIPFAPYIPQHTHLACELSPACSGRARAPWRSRSWPSLFPGLCFDGLESAWRWWLCGNGNNGAFMRGSWWCASVSYPSRRERQSSGARSARECRLPHRCECHSTCCLRTACTVPQSGDRSCKIHPNSTSFTTNRCGQRNAGQQANSVHFQPTPSTKTNQRAQHPIAPT